MSRDHQADPTPPNGLDRRTARGGQADLAAEVKALRRAPVATWDERLDEPEPTEAILRPDEASPEGRLFKLGPLGAGGMGEVVLARDGALRRHVALKILRDAIDRPRRMRQRFATEAQITAQLEHPHIVPVYAQAVDGAGDPCYAMKLIEGQTLREVIDGLPAVSDRSTLGPVLDVFLKVCDAVSYAHGRGVVHRDLKPDNIMVGDHGEVYVLDWGLAAVRGDQEPVQLDPGRDRTLPGTALGTATYMAPEQAGGSDKVGPAADQFSLGALLYEIACRRPPRSTEGSMMEQLTRAAAGHRLPIRGPGRQRLSRELIGIIERATARTPQRRYASVDALAADVRRFLRDEPVHAAPEGVVRSVARWVSRHRQLATATLGALLVAVAVGTAGLALALSSGAILYRWTVEAEAARWRALSGQIDQRAADLDHAMALITGHLQAIDAAATALLQHAEPQPGSRVYAPSDYTDPKRRPVDTAWSDLYQRPLSTRWPASLAAPRSDADRVGDQLRTLAPIRHAMRDAHLLSRQVLDQLAPAEAEAAWRERDGPIRWTLLGTQEGAYLDLPGAAWTPGDFDPRRRPWYTVGRSSDGATWGLPYPEASTGGLLLPCVAAMRTSAGRLLGVAAIDVAFSYLIARHLHIDDPAVHRVLLVDSAGREMVSSDTVGPDGRPTSLGAVWPTPPYPHAHHLSAGGGEVTLPDGATLVMHRPLRTAGWWYVVEIDATADPR